jgi:RNA polymerase sigma factor (sigma-70 family)
VSRGERGKLADPSREEFVALYRLHYPRLVRALTISTGDAAAAEDLAQEAFARTYTRWRRVRAGPNPPGYIYTVGFRLLRRRGALSQTPFDETEQAGLAGASGGQDAVVTESVLRAVVAAMPPRRRACAALCIYLSFSAEEAAVALGISPVTVRVQLLRARRAVEAALAVDAHGTTR